jgi:uncharacterized protein YcaQ
MLAWPGPAPRDYEIDVEDWVTANNGCREDILQRLRSEGPLAARELPDTCVLPWRSTGWTNNRNVMKLLECMERRGEVAVSSRENRERVWDLADRIYPDDPPVPFEEASRRHAERWLAAMGIARDRGSECHGLPRDVANVGEPAVIEGVRGRWRVDPAQVGQPFRGRAALLSPLDRLVFDRKRMVEIFEFDYNLEMYKPQAKRRWGYFALPILYGDRLVGKLDAEADREAGVLRVHAIHRDIDFTQEMDTAIDNEIHALGSWLDLELDMAS